VVQDSLMSARPGQDLERLYRKDSARLWRSLLGFTGDPDLARDAMAEAFAQALGRGDAVKDQDRWVWRAAFRIAAGELKRQSLQRSLTDDRSYEMAESPTKQRAAIILHFYAGYTTRQVAAILGVTTGTVRMHISQGRRRLRRLLENEDG
jgi:RNA polymerase sigma-70 factor, ECF subfamily